MKVRPAVQRFAEDMERVLRKHDKTKGVNGWEKSDCTFGFLVDKFDEEVEEVVTELQLCGFSSETGKNTYTKEVKKELVDVANICMMLCEKMKEE